MEFFMGFLDLGLKTEHYSHNRLAKSRVIFPGAIIRRAAPISGQNDSYPHGDGRDAAALPARTSIERIRPIEFRALLRLAFSTVALRHRCPPQLSLKPNSEVGNEIERTCREPSAVGRVTPCAPRLQPAGARFPRRRLPDPLPIKPLLEFSAPTSFFGLNICIDIPPQRGGTPLPAQNCKTPLFFVKAPDFNFPNLHNQLSICILPPEP